MPCLGAIAGWYRGGVPWLGAMLRLLELVGVFVLYWVVLVPSLGVCEQQCVVR